MKKLFPFLIVTVLGFAIISCERTEYVDNPDSTTVDYPAVYDKTVNLGKINTNNNFLLGYNFPFNNNLLNQDIVLVYRKSNPTENAPIWVPLPKTYFPTQGTMDYTFDFTVSDIQIYLDADFDLTVQNSDFNRDYINNQTFRLVLVPAVFGKNATDLSKLSYEEVISKYNIDDSKVGKL